MPRTEMLGRAQEHGADGAEARALDDIVHRFVSELPGVDPDAIRSVVAEGFARTADAKVQNFRLVLAERWARAHLRDQVAAAGRTEAAAGPGPVVASEPLRPPVHERRRPLVLT